MEGTIELISDGKTGSKFTFHIPYHPAPLPNEKERRNSLEDRIEPTDLSSNETSAKIPSKSTTILLAEDNFVNQKVVVKLLNRLGYEVDIANNGQEAVEMAAKKQYPIILMDIEVDIDL